MLQSFKVKNLRPGRRTNGFQNNLFENNVDERWFCRYQLPIAEPNTTKHNIQKDDKKRKYA